MVVETITGAQRTRTRKVREEKMMTTKDIDLDEIRETTERIEALGNLERLRALLPSLDYLEKPDDYAPCLENIRDLSAELERLGEVAELDCLLDRFERKLARVHKYLSELPENWYDITMAHAE